MKKITFISLLLILSYFDLNAFHMQLDGPHDPKRNRFPVRIDGKWGFIDRTGKIVVSPKYDHVEYFYENRALIRNSNGFGFIDLFGNEIIPCQYKSASNFSNGVAAIYRKTKLNCDEVTLKNGRMKAPDKIETAFIGRNGKLMIPFLKIRVYEFHHGYALYNTNAYTIYEDEECFPINCSSKKVSFKGSRICSAQSDEGFYGLIDKTGKIVIKAIYSGAFYQDGIVYLNGPKSSKYYDLKNKSFINLAPYMHLKFNEGLAVFTKDNKSGYIDKSGKVVIKNIYDYAYNFSDGLACIYFKKSNAYGFINKNGKLVIPPRRFDYKGEFHEGVCAASAMGKWGYINKQGKWIIYPKYKRCYNFNNGVAMVLPNDTYFGDSENVKFMYIDGNEKIIWESE